MDGWLCEDRNQISMREREREREKKDSNIKMLVDSLVGLVDWFGRLG